MEMFSFSDLLPSLWVTVVALEYVHKFFNTLLF